MTRTYKFYCNPYLLYNDSFAPVEFAWGSGTAPQAITGTYAPISYSTISFANVVRLKNYVGDNTARQFTGPCNMYGVYDLPVDYARVLGYREYTVINLSQIGLFWLFWNNNFINQRKLLVSDLEKYSYYRALSVTVKFAPRCNSVPGKISGVTNHYETATTNIGDTPVSLTKIAATKMAISTGTPITGIQNSSGWTWATNGAVESSNPADIPIEVNLKPTEPEAVSFWDNDAFTLIGYLVPGAPDEDEGRTQINFPGWSSSTFGRVTNYPTPEWLSSFRKAGYPRSYISRNKPTSFKFVLPQCSTCVQLNLPSMPATQAWNLYGFVKTTTDNQRTPFTGHKECMKPGLMTAETSTLNPLIYTDEETLRTMAFPKYWNPSNCNLFIPGVLPEPLLNRYKVSFSYKVQYYARVYDDN